MSATVPAEANLYQPSHLLYHFGSDANHPLDTLGVQRPGQPGPWKVVRPLDTDDPITEQHVRRSG